jgi:hypothetical protein
VTVIWWVLAIFAAVIAVYIAQTIYLAAALYWEDKQTIGMRYYGRGPAERMRFKRLLCLHALLLAPVLAINSRLTKLNFSRARITFQGISAPTGSCSVQSFERGAAYQPTPADVFVVTQMKCGTTWMQHVVYEVLRRGAGDLVISGTTLYAVSPWLEGRRSVALENAPLIGAPGHRIIKTHFPTQLCPYTPEAKYVYVVRHPVSCFASCVDFVVTNVGRMAPGLETFEEWFCTSELMWWGTWTEHVKGWWQRSRESDNVLFVHFEDMKRDLPAVIKRVAAFLQIELLEDEVAHVASKCSFHYMQQHQDTFEMQPPHILQTNGALFVSGKTDRHRDVPTDVQARLRAWVAGAFEPGHPVLQSYPDLLQSVETHPVP